MSAVVDVSSSPMGVADAVDGSATKSAPQAATFKDPTSNVPTKPLMIPFEELPDRNTVGDSRTFIQLSKAIASINAMQIFDQWDYTNEGFLGLKEFQAGLLSAGILVESPLIHAAMRRVCLRKMHEDKVAAQEFVAFFLTLCGEDPLEMQTYLQKLSKVVPDGHYGLTTYLDGHSPQVAQYLKRHGHLEVRSDSAQTSKNPEGSQDALDEMEELSEEDWNKSALSMFTPKGMVQVLTFQKGPLPALLFFIIWELAFATFYCLYDDFRFDRAYYYAAQAGLSVGFGSLTEECMGGLTGCDEPRLASAYDVSKFVTILNVLLGSSVIGGALGYFVESALKDHGEWYEAMITAHDEGERIEELEKEEREFSLGLEYLKQFYEDNLMEVRLCLIVLAFIFVGMLYGMFFEEWTFITSLYYCITAMSTAGLQGPNPEHVFGMLFTGTYVLLGVPLYGACLGIFANYLIENNQAKTEEEHFNKVITANECIYFSKLLAKKDDMEAEVAIDDMNEIEFLELELLRTGKVDPDFVDEARQRFREYDCGNTGFVNWTEIVAINLFRQYHADSDDDGPDLLNMTEFKACVDDLSKAPYSLIDTSQLKSYGIERVFLACIDSHVHDGVTTTQFYHFVAAVMGGMSDLRNWKGGAPPKRNMKSMRHA